MRPFIIFLACLALCFMLITILVMLANAMTLEISGNATGQGLHTMDVSLPDISNLTPEEATYLLGPGHNFNITKAGLITFENGSSWQIIRCPVTGMSELTRVI